MGSLRSQLSQVVYCVSEWVGEHSRGCESGESIKKKTKKRWGSRECRSNAFGASFVCGIVEDVHVCGVHRGGYLSLPHPGVFHPPVTKIPHFIVLKQHFLRAVRTWGKRRMGTRLGDQPKVPDLSVFRKW